MNAHVSPERREVLATDVAAQLAGLPVSSQPTRFGMQAGPVRKVPGVAVRMRMSVRDWVTHRDSSFRARDRITGAPHFDVVGWL